MTSARAKGLQYVREVRKILEANGLQVWGPGYSPRWLPTGMIVVHEDYFNLFDLLAISHNMIEGHQVTTLTNRSVKLKALKQAGVAGYVWCRTSENGRIKYRVWRVCGDQEVEFYFYRKGGDAQ